MKPDKRILITGISGFIGSKLKEIFSVNGYEVWGISRQKTNDSHIVQGDLNSNRSTAQAFSKIPDCSIVIHAAALAHSTTKQPDQDYFQTNTEVTNNLIKHLREKKVKIIYLSSIAVYGLDGYKSPVTTENEKRPATQYGLSKLKCEEIIQGSGIDDYFILRLAPVFDDNHLDDVKKRVYIPGQNFFKITIKPAPYFSLCHINTVTSLVFNLVNKKISSSKILNVADPIPHNQNELACGFPGVKIPVYAFLFLPIYRFFNLFESGLGYSIRCNLGKLLCDNIYE